MGLSPDQLRYVLTGHCVGAFLINVALNAAIGYAMFAGVDPVPTWSVESSAGPDLIGTCFFLPAITCLVVTPIVRGHLRSGQVPAAPRPTLPGWLAPLGWPLVRRSLCVGLATLVVGGLGVALVLLAVAPASFGFAWFLGLKAGFSGVLAAAITPFLAIAAIADGTPMPIATSEGHP